MVPDNVKLERVLRKRITTALATTLAVIGGVIGSFVLIDRMDRQEQDTLSRWPMVVGNIVSAAEVTKGTSSDNEYTVAAIWFSYMVNGQSYLSGQDFDVASGREYPVGSSVTVHYSTKKPGISFIDSRRFWGQVTWIGAVLGYVYIAAAIGCICTWAWAFHK
jgi:hypothetical protein